MSEEQETQPFGRNTCHICGGTDFIWGRLVGYRYSEFLSDENSRKFLGDLRHREHLRARKCKTCENIQIFSVGDK